MHCICSAVNDPKVDFQKKVRNPYFYAGSSASRTSLATATERGQLHALARRSSFSRSAGGRVSITLLFTRAVFGVLRHFESFGLPCRPMPLTVTPQRPAVASKGGRTRATSSGAPQPSIQTFLKIRPPHPLDRRECPREDPAGTRCDVALHWKTCRKSLARRYPRGSTGVFCTNPGTFSSAIPPHCERRLWSRASARACTVRRTLSPKTPSQNSLTCARLPYHR